VLTRRRGSHIETIFGRQIQLTPSYTGPVERKLLQLIYPLAMTLYHEHSRLEESIYSLYERLSNMRTMTKNM